jgi:hypothetical protein
MWKGKTNNNMNAIIYLALEYGISWWWIMCHKAKSDIHLR